MSDEIDVVKYYRGMAARQAEDEDKIKGDLAAWGDIDDPHSEAFRRSGMIYSPEASDDSRYGDWQTKAVIAAFLGLVILAVLVWLIHPFAKHPTADQLFGCSLKDSTASGECK